MKIINIGRQFGSGGHEIAELIGTALGLTVYDSELVTRAARDSGLSSELFKGVDEKKRLFRLGGLFGVNRYGGFSRSPIGDNELFRIQSETIRRIALEGPAVFVGRASDYVLRDMDCLDVFVCAPAADRISRISARMNIDAPAAAAMIEKKDAERKDFYNYFTFGHWGVAANYDICINSSVLGIEGTAEYIIGFLNRSL